VLGSLVMAIVRISVNVNPNTSSIAAPSSWWNLHRTKTRYRSYTSYMSYKSDRDVLGSSSVTILPTTTNQRPQHEKLIHLTGRNLANPLVAASNGYGIE
jgi:hypothetical protein